MRLLAGVLIALALVAAPASAGQVDPGALVLLPRHVPAGFRLDVHDSGLRTNEIEARDSPQTREAFRRWGRVTGYRARYRNGMDAAIEARADLFRTGDGARKLLAWSDRELRRGGMNGVVRARAGIGSEGWLYTGTGQQPILGRFTVVVWRYGRVWSGLAGIGIPKATTLALARAQQRRIAAALG